MGDVLIGTCSWTDRSLITSGAFYPPWARSPEARLQFYAAEFPIVEVDSSYYALPTQKACALWAERTPPGFLFDIKSFSLLTWHPTRPQTLPREVRDALPAELKEKANLYSRDVPDEIRQDIWARFREALLPLDSAGKLGVVLFQFPRWFIPGRERLDYILFCQEQLPQYRVAVEFRNALWLGPEHQGRTLDFLRRNKLAFVCVDEPQGFPSSVPPIAEATAEVALVRFHGRNRETWEKRGIAASERFDYYYSPDELREWIPRVSYLREHSTQLHLLFNTNAGDQGVVNAGVAARLLAEEEETARRQGS
ncbi:MAG: DUF72 domain-containing protein [Chloroflexi bacterium]|nr:DUF72 domain-containing protein [Chloroflexota bacterium]